MLWAGRCSCKWCGFGSASEKLISDPRPGGGQGWACVLPGQEEIKKKEKESEREKESGWN